MLVIISDLHLTDGTSGETISAGAFRIFRARLSDMAYDASWRANKRYEPIEKFDLILLGDIFDLIRSTKWLDDTEGKIRPWDDSSDPVFIKKIDAINDAILAHNADSLEVLRGLSQERSITIPPATADGDMIKVSRDPDDPRRVPVRVDMHYMIGNHDWFYHLPGPEYDAIRQRVVDTVGLTQLATRPFPHDLAEDSHLEMICALHDVYARHGDIHDPDNYDGDRGASSLGDAIVVELLNRFPAEVQRQLGTKLPPATLDGLKELDNVRPMLVIPVWINGLLYRTCKDERLAGQVKDIWDTLADEMLSLPFVRARDKALNPFDRVDQFEYALKFAKGISFHAASRLVTWLQSKHGGDVSYYHYAFNEPAFTNKTARFIVHGHTHHHEIIPLDTSLLGGRTYDQMYLNSGTWRRVHELARFNPKEQEFQGFHEMTYLAFFRDGERRGRPFEVWSGTLGVS